MCNDIFRLQILSMLPVTQVLAYLVYCTGLNMLFYNCNVKTNLICNESLFQQTDMVKYRFVIFRTGEFPIFGIFSTSSKSDILNYLIMLVHLY